MLQLSNKYKKIIKLLELDKPLVIFDIETTGLIISTDRIVSLAYIKIWNDGRTKKEEIVFNPECPIPAEAIAIHGIREDDIKDKPKFKEKSQELWEIFNDSYYAGFNIYDFDLPVLRREFIRVGMDFDYSEKNIIDSKYIYRHMAPPNLSSAYSYYCHKDYRGSNGASQDVEISAEILMKQLDQYRVVRDLDFVNGMYEDNGSGGQTGSTSKFYWVNGEAYFAFSKYKNKALNEVIKQDPKFIDWILAADFCEDTKIIVRTALEEIKKKSFSKYFAKKDLSAEAKSKKVSKKDNLAQEEAQKKPKSKTRRNK